MAAIRIAGRDRRLIWIEVGPMLSEAMLGLGIDQREAVDEPSGTLRVEQQTFASRSRNGSRVIALGPLPARDLVRRLRREEWLRHQVCPLVRKDRRWLGRG